MKTAALKGSPASPFKTREQRAGEHADKRLAVLRTAAELFVTQGFHSTKLSDVADRLNITKPAIYYYFESKDEIRRRIEEATRYVDIDQLALSPQCGFASTVHGNAITTEQQADKIRLVVEVAEEVWGTVPAMAG